MEAPSVLEFFQLKVLELVNRLESDEGQTSSEYVAVTAVAVVIALTVIYATLSGALTSSISTVGSRIVSFVNGEFT